MLRSQLDVRRQLTEHPLRWGAAAAALAFLVAGGPRRLGKLASSRLRRRPGGAAGRAGAVEKAVRTWMEQRDGTGRQRQEDRHTVRRLAREAAKETEQPLWEKAALRAFELGLTAATAELARRITTRREAPAAPREPAAEDSTASPPGA
jgi:hypothetical protein